MITYCLAMQHTNQLSMDSTDSTNDQLLQDPIYAQQLQELDDFNDFTQKLKQMTDPTEFAKTVIEFLVATLLVGHPELTDGATYARYGDINEHEHSWIFRFGQSLPNDDQSSRIMRAFQRNGVRWVCHLKKHCCHCSI